MCKSIQPLIDDYSKNSKYMVYYYDTVDDRNSNYSAMIDTLKSIGVEFPGNYIFSKYAIYNYSQNSSLTHSCYNLNIELFITITPLTVLHS